MLFESFGKALFSRLRPLFFYPLLLAAPFLALFSLSLSLQDLEEKEDLFRKVKRKSPAALERKRKKTAFLQRHGGVSPFFLAKEIESLSFCSKERLLLESLLAHPAVFPKQPLKERLEALRQNRLSFLETEVSISPFCTEAEERQKKAIQVEEDDLKRLLSILEDAPIGVFLPNDQNPPQFLLLDFQIKRKLSSVQTTNWELDMNLLKREFYP